MLEICDVLQKNKKTWLIMEADKAKDGEGTGTHPEGNETYSNLEDSKYC